MAFSRRVGKKPFADRANVANRYPYWYRFETESRLLPVASTRAHSLTQAMGHIRFRVNRAHGLLPYNHIEMSLVDSDDPRCNHQLGKPPAPAAPAVHASQIRW